MATTAGDTARPPARTVSPASSAGAGTATADVAAPPAPAGTFAAAPQPHPAVTMQQSSSPPVEQDTRNGAPSYTANNPSVTVDPGVLDPITSQTVDPGPVSLTVCPDPEAWGTVQLAACPVVGPTSTVSPPDTSVPQPSPVTVVIPI